jgi:hypothetical protein
MRLLQALADAGMDTRAPWTNAWIEKKALEIGLEGGQLVSALAYAGSEGWLVDAPRRGWTSLTRAGAAVAGRQRSFSSFALCDPRHELLNCSLEFFYTANQLFTCFDSPSGLGVAPDCQFASASSRSSPVN